MTNVNNGVLLIDMMKIKRFVSNSRTHITHTRKKCLKESWIRWFWWAAWDTYAHANAMSRTQEKWFDALHFHEHVEDNFSCMLKCVMKMMHRELFLLQPPTPLYHSSRENIIFGYWSPKYYQWLSLILSRWNRELDKNLLLKQLRNCILLLS